MPFLRTHRGHLFLLFVTLLFINSYSVCHAAPSLVRVLVNDTNTKLNLSIDGPFIVKSLPSKEPILKGTKPVNLLIAPTATGIRIGKQEFPIRGFIVEPASDRTLTLEETRFRGSLEILKNQKNLLDAINFIDIETYLYGVLQHEVPYWWPMEALKAQAVAARTYALYQAQVSQAQPFDLKSDTSSQMYGGSTTERFRTKKAVDETKGEVMTFQGKIFPTYFHATCAGMTAGAEELWNIKLAPLSGHVRCDYCLFSPHHEWQATIPLSTIEEKLNSVGRPVGQILKMEIITQTPSHRAGTLKITGTNQETTVAAKDLRILIGGDKIRSTQFTVAVKSDQAHFTGKGWGHGIGLCQWGTLGQSLVGHHYQDILKFYYPGADISKS